MGVIKLLAFGLRQAIGGPAAIAVDGGEKIVEFVKRRVTDHSTTLPSALAKANDRAWQSVAIALAGDGFIDQIKVLFAAGDDRGIRRQVQQFLANQTEIFNATPSSLRHVCLLELRQARKCGALSADNLTPDDLARQTAGFQRLADSQGLINASWHAMAAVTDDLGERYPNLCKLLRQPTPAGPPILISAFAYFFRREVESDAELSSGLTFDALRQLSAAQADAFSEVGGALSSIGDRFDEAMDRLGRIDAIVTETNDAVLDMRVELNRLAGVHLTGANEIRSLLHQVKTQLDRASTMAGEVRGTQNSEPSSQTSQLPASESAFIAAESDVRPQSETILKVQGPLEPVLKMKADKLVDQGWDFYRDDLFERTISCCTEAIHIDPGNSMAFEFRGEAYRRVGEFDKAITDLERALQLHRGFNTSTAEASLERARDGDKN